MRIYTFSSSGGKDKLNNWNPSELKAELTKYNKEEIYKNKIKALQTKMSEKDLKAVICFKPQNTFFLSGFNPVLYSHPVVVIVPAEGEAVLLVHSLRANHSKDEAAIKNIRLFGMWGTQKPIADNAYDAISIILDELNAKHGNIGYEGDFLSVGQFKKIEDISKAAAMIDVKDMLLKSRVIKTEYEIILLKLASYMTNLGMKAAIDTIRSSEIEVSIAAEYAMRKAWSKDLGEFEVASFGNTEGGIVNALWCYSSSGKRVPYGCDCPKDRTPKNGEVCLPVVWAVCDGCHSENERTVIIGKLDDYHQKAYDAMLEGRKRAFAMIKEGVTAGQVYEAATSAYVEAGFKDYLPGRVGHGMGQSLHEEPSLSRNSEVVLQAGMVVTVEPGLVFPDWGSVRHSDTVVVRKNGIEKLTMTENDFIVG